MVNKEIVGIDFLNTKRTLHIYIPEYVKPPYQVLYMFDGHNLFYDHDATYGTSWGLKDYFDQNHSNLMIVGVECNHEGNRRLCEFSPYSFKDNYWGIIDACGKEFAHWMATDLVNYIESKYDVLKDCKHRYIGGSSMGGLMALFMGITYPTIYSKSICVSPYIDHIYSSLLKDIKKSTVNHRQFYISFGGKEVNQFKYLRNYVDKITSIQSQLTLKNNQVFMVSKANATHCEACWAKETKLWTKYLNI